MNKNSIISTIILGAIGSIIATVIVGLFTSESLKVFFELRVSAHEKVIT